MHPPESRTSTSSPRPSFQRPRSHYSSSANSTHGTHRNALQSSMRSADLSINLCIAQLTSWSTSEEEAHREKSFLTPFPVVTCNFREWNPRVRRAYSDGPADESMTMPELLQSLMSPSDSHQDMIVTVVVANRGCRRTEGY